MKKRREGTVTVCGVATLFPSGFNSGHLVLVSAFVFSLLQISLVLWFRFSGKGISVLAEARKGQMTS
ncbi:hypothetical protein I79_016277 [Cricetulus griseus]|uniref:Transmembrane protein n=1 Tax=Cricetulus griseus TaxID=10029 RepID=G3HYY4_CRIGR|nr:hypothetical protein I79_016277 [Cricetulus griseus]